MQLLLRNSVRSIDQQKKGFYADALGLATVVLPEGWEQRLTPLTDTNGKTLALFVEIHDIAVSKFIAGREKDFEFLVVAFLSDYLAAETFIERLRTIINSPQQAALEPRLKSFGEYLKKHSDLRAVNDLIGQFKKEIKEKLES